MFKTLKTLLGGGAASSGSPGKPPSQLPRGSYVYVHEDEQGRPFYVGKGIQDRAWVYGRDPLWEHYVRTRLGGRYRIRILVDGVDDREALRLEEEAMAKYGDTLVNRQNFHRGLNMEVHRQLEHWRGQRDRLHAQAKLEGEPVKRLELLKAAMQAHDVQAGLVSEPGLVGEILRELPAFGHASLLDDVVSTFLDVGDVEGARKTLDGYVQRYTNHANHATVVALNKAVAKGKPRRRAKRTVFTLPERLPPDWEFADEGGHRIARLRRDIPPPVERASDRISVLAGLLSGDPSVALNYAKKCVVADEGRRPEKVSMDKLNPWFFLSAAKMAKKQRDPLEQCLFLARLAHLHRAHPTRYAEFMDALQKATAKLP